VLPEPGSADFGEKQGQAMAIDHDKARRNMVDCQVRTSDVTNLELLSAFLSVPREAFVPQGLAEIAYLDEELPLGGGRFLIAPAPLARLLQAALIKPGDHVLDIGCATGYSTALIATLGATVTGIEASAELAGKARAAIASLGLATATIREGRLEAGLAAEAPFDVIFVGGSVEQLPEVLKGQLKPGGRFVAVEGRGNSAFATLYVNDDGNVSGRRLFNCALPLLPGFERTPQFVF
jgi:protein-L-isoaspartate(D-aspartate) O-methyltransferase